MGSTPSLYDHAVALDIDAAGKTALLGALAAEVAQRLGRAEDEILGVLQDRERLGSTALGRGVALPHAQLGQLAHPALSFARLRRPIDFGARDGEPVDLVLLVLWPADSPQDFLPALAEICRVLREPKLLRRLRGAASAGQALALLRAAGCDAPGGSQTRETDAR